MVIAPQWLEKGLKHLHLIFSKIKGMGEFNGRIWKISESTESNYDDINSDETPILEDDENNKYVNIINDIKSDPKLSVVGKKVFDYVINL